MKCLTICHQGNSRSVALAYILKDYLRHEAIAIGWNTTSPETRTMLYAWADAIFPVVPEPLTEILSQGHEAKTKFFHVPGDPYFRGYAPELLSMYLDFLTKIGFVPGSPVVHPAGVIDFAASSS